MVHKDPVVRKAWLAKRDRLNRERTQRLIWDYKREHSCVDCGEDDPVVLEFDHREPERKAFQLCDAADKRRTAEELEAEIAKCDIRCANCHRRKTYFDRVLADL